MAQESVLRIVIDSRNAERNARNIANELQSIERNGNYATRSMDSMSVATRSLVGYMGGLVTIGAAISKMDAYTGLQNRLKLVTDSQAELNTAMNDTFGIAQKTAATWDSVAMVYQRFADNADRLGISMKQTAALTETVSKAISVSGGSAASAEAALMQFGQALASGVLRGEEFNSIAEQAPGLLKAIAFGLNTNVGSLRAMAQDGKITGDVLVDALGKAKPYIDDLFNRTDFTISQSFTKLSNEVTKFVGEAGKGSGAASALSDSIGFLAKNLSTIADIAIVGGVAMLTKTILAQTVAIQGSITASVARRAADTAVLQSQVQLAALEVQRTRQIAAQAISEIGLARQELNSATTRTARAAATVRLTQAEIAHRIALNQTTAAIATNTAAQNALNASRAIGARMLALVGGPIGAITLGVAGLAAGYMYLKNRTAEANAKLEEQGKVAEKTNEELTKLSGNDKKNAVSDLTAAFNAQNAELSKSKEAVDAVLFAIRASSVENEKARKVTEDAKNGVISYNQAIELLNKMDISPELYEMLKKTALQYDENSNKAGKSQKALSILGFEFTLSGNKAQNAANQVATNTGELKNNETAARDAAKAQKGYFDSLNQDVLSANERLAYMNLGFTKEVIDQINKLQEAKQKALGDGVTAIVTTEEINKIVQAQKTLDAVKNKEDEIAEAKRKQNKEAEKSAKLAEKQYKYSSADLKMMQNVAKLSAEANLDGIGAKYGIPKNYLAGLMAQESGGNKNAVSPTGAIGYFQTTAAYRKDNGISVADSKNLPVIAEVVSKNLAKAFEKLGNWDAAIRSHNAGLAGSAQFEDKGRVNGNAARNKEVANFSPSVNKWIVGLGGSSLKTKGAANPLDDLKEYFAFLEDQAKSRKSLEFEVANEVTKIRENLKDKLIELDKAGFSPERTKELRDEFETRADNEIAIAKHALKTKLDDYGAFKKTESELLKDSFDEKKFYAAHDLELDAEGRKKAVALLDEQLKQEQGLLMLARETRIFQFEQAMYTEMELIKKRYDFELQEAARLQNPEERARRVNAASSTKKQDESDLLWNSTINYSNAVGIDTSAEQALKARQDAIDKMRENDFIKQKEYEAQSFESMRQYERDKQDLALSSLNVLLSATSATWSNMTQLVKEGAGEQSGAYKTMFAIQQAFAMTSATVSALLAYNQVLSSPWNTDLVSKATAANIVLGMGMANVGMIAAQTIAGFETGGYTGSGGRKDVAGVVHGQEYVLNAAATKRVGVGTLDAINSGKGLGGGGGDVIAPITVSVSVQSNGESSVDTEGQSKQLGQMIGNAVRAVIMQEKRQGGLLSK